MVGPPVFPSRSREAFVLISKICPPFIVASSLSLLDPPAGLQRYRCCPIPAAHVSQSFRVPAEPVQLAKRPRWYFSRKTFTTAGIASAGNLLLHCCHPLTTLRCESGFEGEN